MTRRRGMTLIELVACMTLLTTVLLVCSRTLVLGFAWGETTHEVLRGKLRATELSEALVEALRQGTPIAALSIGPDGSLREEVVAGARAAWSDDALILAREGVYTVIAQEGARVVRHDLRWDGGVQVTALVDGVRALALERVLEHGALRGIDYRLTFEQGGPPIAGFVGLRTEARARTGPLPQPTPAPRFGGAR